MTFSKIRQYIKGVLSNLFNKTLSNIAPKFDPTETYSIGNRVIYNGDLYRFTSAHTGAWTSTDASKTNINALLNNNTFACGGGYAPIGTVIAYMGTRAPSDYLICDGTVYNIADYPQLADFFESQFGRKNKFGGDGTTTFAVPDLRGEFLRGTGTNSHANQGSGAAVGVHQDGTVIPNVIVEDSAAYFPHKQGTSTQVGGVDAKYRNNDYVRNISIASSAQQAWGEFDLYTSRPTNTSVLYCIKAVVAGEVYSTEERVVGTWIDGKPLYQKTVKPNLPTTIVDGTAEGVLTPFADLGISNPEFGFVATGVCINKTSGAINNANSAWIGDHYYVLYTAFQLSLGGLFVITNREVLKSSICDLYVTVQYTKTTDV